MSCHTPTPSAYGAEVSAGVPSQKQPAAPPAPRAFEASKQAHIFPITSRKDEKHWGANKSFSFIL